MDITDKIDKMLTDTTIVGDVESNLAQGSVDVVTDKCPEGQYYCPKRKKCMPKKEESTVVSGDGYIAGDTNIDGSGQTRAVGSKDKEIEILKTKVPGMTTRFNKLLGAYTVDDKE